MSYIDLHTHTSFSDAEVSLEETLQLAEGLGLSLLSVTDHDMVDAYAHLPAVRHLYHGKILPGIELSAAFDGGFIEVLGYGIDIAAMRREIKSRYLTRYEKHVLESKIETETLLKKGVVLDLDFVHRLTEYPDTMYDPQHKSCRDLLLHELKSHPENARFFGSEAEFATLNHKIFSRNYLYDLQSPLACDLSPLYPSVEEVVGMISRCGGLSFLAHLYVYPEDVRAELDRIVAFGLDGIECAYGTFTPEQGRFLSDYCDQKGLLKCGGSDHHGCVMRPENLMGRSMGAPIELALIEPWLPRVEQSLL